MYSIIRCIFVGIIGLTVFFCCKEKEQPKQKNSRCYNCRLCVAFDNDIVCAV